MKTAMRLRWSFAWGVGQAVATLLTVSLLLAMGAQQLQKSLDVERIALRDKAGRVRAAIQTGEQGAPEIGLFDEDGDAVVEITANPASLVLSNKDHSSRICLNLLPDRSAQVEIVQGDRQQGITLGVDLHGRSRLILKDRNSRARVSLGLYEEACLPLLAFSDSHGDQIIWLGTMKDGSESLGISDAKGTKRLELGTLVDGSSRVYLYDPAGHRRINLGVSPYGRSGLGIFDDKQKGRVGLEYYPDGSAAFGLFEADGKSRVHLGVDVDKSAELEIFDPRGQTRANLRVDDTGDSFLRLLDSSGLNLLRLPVVGEKGDRGGNR
jgi:hypothetical protein